MRCGKSSTNSHRSGDLRQLRPAPVVIKIGILSCLTSSIILFIIQLNSLFQYQFMGCIGDRFGVSEGIRLQNNCIAVLIDLLHNLNRVWI